MSHTTDRISSSSKRKLEDYGPNEEDEFFDLISVRMKKDELNNTAAVLNSTTTNHLSNITETRVSDARSSSDAVSAASSSNSRNCSGRSLHFFVRMMSGGNTIVIHANSDDSVESVHEQIRKITGIPIIEQRLIYRGKQLQWEQSLADCSIQNDAGLQLVGRMRSTEYPRTWRVVNDLVSSICRLCRKESQIWRRIVMSRTKEFLDMTPREDEEMSAGHLQVFKSAGVPTALVMLFLSPIPGNKQCAEDAIRHFLIPHIDYLPKNIQNQCAPIVFEFCKLLSKTPHDVRYQLLFISCRNTLGQFFESIGVDGWRFLSHAKATSIIEEIYPFVSELSNRLCVCLETNVSTQTLLGEVRDFASFSIPLHGAIQDQVGGAFRVPISLANVSSCYVTAIGSLHTIFLKMLRLIDQGLKKLERLLPAKDGASEINNCNHTYPHYLAIMKGLKNISKLYQGAEEEFCDVLRSRRLSVNALIKYATRKDDNSWLLLHKDVVDFESKRHLVMMMLPEIKDEYDELHEMLIDRSNLLSESFGYIARADSESLQGGLFMEFKNEEATGPGVLREWFYLVCQAIFNPQNPLFLACPNDRRRFFPNPASHVEPLHLEYFGFCGRLIALALMHKVQVGIAFDRVFFLQLAGNFVSLEDVRDADPCLYTSCKKILEMDAEFLDSDGLGLTFVREVEELGSRKVVELCPGGKGIALNSRNREDYVNLLIHHRFVTSISEQVANFSRGFGDILCNSSVRKFFFQGLELEDLDRMLYGSDGAICVKDWRTHTDYNGYKEGDRQICWFWKIVEGMPPEQQRVLLIFWTSVKYLPVEGFSGLQSRLYIYKTSDSHDRLPSSHTCFYRLCLPPYPTLGAMRNALQTITQEHVSSSFGIW